MKWLSIVYTCLVLSGCCTTNAAPAAAGHTLRGWDEWAVADMVIGTLIEAGQCEKGEN